MAQMTLSTKQKQIRDMEKDLCLQVSALSCRVPGRGGREWNRRGV